jgi:hypothetical protein
VTSLRPRSDSGVSGVGLLFLSWKDSACCRPAEARCLGLCVSGQYLSRPLSKPCIVRGDVQPRPKTISKINHGSLVLSFLDQSLQLNQIGKGESIKHVVQAGKYRGITKIFLKFMKNSHFLNIFHKMLGKSGEKWGKVGKSGKATWEKW